jgi:diacylglycerol kinase family enzyme
MNVVIVYNSRAGSALAPDELERRFSKQGFTVEALIAFSDTIATDLKPYIKKDAIIAVMGGDGTLSRAARILANTGAIFAPIPGGTLNHFTKDLGISQDIDQAIKDLKTAKPHAIDAGSVNDIVFINNSSIGLYPSSLETRQALRTSKLSKWPAAILGSLRALSQYHTYHVKIDGEAMTTPFVFVGNNDYHLADPMATGRTTLTAGKLAVYTIDAASRIELFKLLGWALIGRLKDAPEAHEWKTEEIIIHTRRRRITISRDGELQHIETPLHYKILPGALRVLGGKLTTS